MSAIYKAVINVADRFVPAKLAPVWNHPAGPKTIFFWAPSFKWALVIAGIGDLARPAEKLSIYQSTALAATGPKTVFFWAPSVKWVLVIAGLGDLKRPPEKMSLFQSSALAVTGSIWARYSLVIIPINYYLFTVNVFVALTGFYQLSKIYRYRSKLASQKVADPTQ